MQARRENPVLWSLAAALLLLLALLWIVPFSGAGPAVSTHVEDPETPLAVHKIVEVAPEN